MAQIDRLFSQIDPNCGEFVFDENVARVFDDMICRSIPLYADVQRCIPPLVNLLPHDPIRVFDLGCSTGTSLIHLSQSLPDRNLLLTGVDNSAAMLAQCREKIDRADVPHQIQTCLADLSQFQPTRASVVLLNYTLQFVDVAARPAMLRRICEALSPDGFLLISEKVVHPQQDFNDAMVELYFEFKRRQGYSELEIARKRDALENVLVPLTVEENLAMFSAAGFGHTEQLLKWFNFVTFVCYPNPS